MRRRVTVLITFLAGLYFFLEFMLPTALPVGAPEGTGFRFGRFDEQITIGFTAVGAMAFALGALSILRAHGGRIARRRKGWVVSAALLLSMLASSVIGAAMWRARARSSAMARELEQLATAEAQILSSATTAPVPPHLRDVPAEKLPPELQRPATVEERAAAQTLLNAALSTAAASLDAQPRPPFTQEGIHPADKLRTAVDRAGRAATLALSRLAAGDSDGAQPPLEEASGALQAGATAQRQVANLLLEASVANHVYDLMFRGLYVALGSAMFSLLAFYIATAAYRAFRIRSREAALLMVAALLVMLGQIPVGVWLADRFFDAVGLDDWSITQVRLWILRVVNTAAFRGIALGSAIAGLSMAWRVWWSMDSGALLTEPVADGQDGDSGEAG